MLIKQFKKNYFAYFFGIIIPASINFLTVPLLKNFLGSSKFGIYSYYLSILIIINSSFAGGISQAILRLQTEYNEKQQFYYSSLWIVFFTSVIISIPLFVFIQISYKSFPFSLILILSFFLSNFYVTLLAITQAHFFAVSCAISESLRAVIFVSLSFFLLYFFPLYNFVFLLFISLSASYFAGCFFLFTKSWISLERRYFNIKAILEIAKKIVKYGGYLVGWFFCSYALSMANRFIIAAFYGKESIGNFTASFDILNKSIVLLLSPIYISLFPLVIKSFSEGQHEQVKFLIKRLTLLEAGLLVISLTSFFFFGFKILSKILNSPATNEYLFIDIQIICSTFIWQMAILQHKYMELEKKTNIMLLMIFIAFIISIIIDTLLIPIFGLRFSAMGFLTGGVCYFLLVIYYKSHYINKKTVLLNTNQ